MKAYDKIDDAIKVARLYYYQNIKTEDIAIEMNISRSTVSRLLQFARDEGLITIRITDQLAEPRLLEKKIIDKFGIEQVHIVPVPDISGENEWLTRVSHYTAKYLNTLFDSNMTLGIAWGTTLTAITKCLEKKCTQNSRIVQLNGAGNIRSMGIEYASEIILKFSENYQARAYYFPLPAFFDHVETKNSLWKERSIRQLLDIQDQADILLYSIGAVNAGVPSRVHSDGYLDKKDYQELENLNVVGDIATVFFKENGTYDNIPLNLRASGPNLDLFKKKHGICVVSGLAKVQGLQAALNGKLMTELIVDQPTAQELIKKFIGE
jgi:deoxyribonucleoside regulator